MKTIKEQLLLLGLKENEIDSHQSDLYVLKNTISEKWLGSYKHKGNVATFVSEIDNKTWYEIPFGNSEYFTKQDRKF